MAVVVRLADGRGGWLPLRLAEDENGRPLFRASTLNPIQPSVQLGQAGYGNFLPDVSGVVANDDLSDGVGLKVQKAETHPFARRYYYGEWWDQSAGYGQKGPKVTTLSTPANSGPLRGSYELNGTIYLVLDRIVAKWTGSGTDTLSNVFDLGAGISGGGAATFYRQGAEAAIVSNTSNGGATVTLDDANDRVAFLVLPDDFGVRRLSRLDVYLHKSGTPTGNVRVGIYEDRDGRPGGAVIVTASKPASSLDASSAAETFRFEEGEADFYTTYNEPFWVVVDAAGADASNTVLVGRATDSSYGQNTATSDDGGVTWTTSSTVDYRWEVYAQQSTATAFVGKETDGARFGRAVDESGLTDDTYRLSSLFCVAGGYLVRDVYPNAENRGGIQWSTDGRTWSDTLPVGDVTQRITSLTPLGSLVVVGKRDSIWVVDPATGDMQQTQGSASASTNGQGACAWFGTAFVPFAGRLVAIQGDFDAGFTIHKNVGLSALPEYDFPHGAGRVVAVRGDRHHLYAVVSASGSGYRLYKASDPLRRVQDRPAPDWHGSLATLGDGSQSITYVAYHEPGGTANPEMFLTGTGNSVLRIRLPVTPDPAADSGYLYDADNTSQLFRARVTGNFPLHQKAWLAESLTFVEEPTGGAVDVLYDTQDGAGYRLLERLNGTGSLPYPDELLSRQLAVQYRVTNASTSSSPLLLAGGTTFAVRNTSGEIVFTAQAEDGLSAERLGVLLGVDKAHTLAGVQRAQAGGTRVLLGPDGEPYTVLVRSVQRVLAQERGDGTPHGDVVQVTCVRVG